MGGNNLPIPATPDSISPEWLTRALRRSGAVRRAKVVSISVRPVAAGSGFVGQAARLYVEYDRKEPGAPATMFVKLSSADREVREKMRTVGLYEAEAEFYRDLAATEQLPIRVPRPYVSLYDPTTAASILLVEDLGHARFGDNLTGCSPAEARVAVQSIAQLHAHFWQSPRLKSCQWLRSIDNDCGPPASLYCAMLPQFEERCAEFATPGLLATARKFGEVQQDYYSQCSRGPHTLVHGDFRADNLAFTENPGDKSLIVFDWQCTSRSHGARDLAYFTCSSMTTAQRRDTEQELMQLYYETLLAHGVKEYSPKDLTGDFRYGLGRPLSVLVVAGGALDFSSERGIKLARELCERIGTALEDHDFVGLLEDMPSAGSRAVSGVSIEKHETYSGGYDPLILQALAEREVNRDAAFFVPYLKPDMRVLDCGCGPGGISLGLAPLLSKGQVVGIDVQASQLEMGRRQAREHGLTNVEFKHASIYELPFEDAAFDAVLAHAVLYHLGEPMKALAELRRVLKPRGLIGLRDADIDGDVYHPPHPELARFWKLAELVISHSGGDPRFGRKHRQILREAGFVEIVATASSDSFGTPETTTGFSKYWTDVFLTQHHDLIVSQGWAAAQELAAMRDALLSWGGGPDAFYSRCRCEAVARKPAN